MDPEDLRRRLHDVVSDVRPTGDSLRRLRAALPARRRRRQTMISAAAVVATAVVAVGALYLPGAGLGHRTSADPGAPGGLPGSVGPGHSNSTQDGRAAPGFPDRPGHASGGALVPGTAAPGGPSGQPPPSILVTPSTNGPTGGASPNLVPVCAGGALKQIGQSATVSATGGTGYLKLQNVTSNLCVLTNPPPIKVSGASLSVRQHTVKDGTLLPNPGSAPVLLAPSAKVQLAFSWLTPAKRPAVCAATTTSMTLLPKAVLSYEAGSSGASKTFTVGAPIDCGDTVYVTNLYPLAG
jgi:hypothetical protein